MVIRKVTISAVAKARFQALAWLFFLLLAAVSWFVPQAALAEDDPPPWYRIRTNSVPYRPENLTVDSTGAVWVTTANDSEYEPGVWRLPPAGTSFQYLTNSRANNWLTGDYNHVVEKPQLDAEINYVIQDDDGNVWYALNNRTVLVEKANDSWLPITMENTQSGFSDTTHVDSVHTIHLIDNQDGTQDALLVAYKSLKRLDPSFNVTETVAVYSSYNNDLIRDAYIDSQGRHWMANERGVYMGTTLYNMYLVAQHPEYSADPEVPQDNSPITGIMEDSSGNMWFVNATYGTGGVFCLTTGDDWVYYNLSTQANFSSNAVHWLAPASDGGMWFAPNYSGIVKYSPADGGTWTRTTCASLGLESEQVLSMQEQNGVLWFVADVVTNYGSGVHGWTLGSRKEDPQVVSYNYRKTSTTLTSHRINAIAGDLSGGVWFAAYDAPSVARLKADGTWIQYKEDTMGLPGDPVSGSVTGVGVDSRNIAYFAPTRRAPIAYDINTEQWLDLPTDAPAPPADTYFYNLYLDPLDGKWFLGANNVYHLNADNTAWEIFNTNDAAKFPDYRIQYALMDGEENIWFMTTFISTPKVSVRKKAPEGGDPTWLVFTRGDASGFLGGPRLYVDKNGKVWNTASQIFDSETNTWVTQTDTTLYDTRPMPFLNGGIPANMKFTGAPVPANQTNQDLMTVDTRGNVYFCGGMVWLQSINAGIVVRSPVKGDIDRDGVIELRDAVLSVGSVAGMASGLQSSVTDVTGDGKVDMVETLYVMQVVAGLR
ncbi:MAG: transcriptional regulator [Desulfatibacillum sp.]|nr:transcriptional regulator [Desulfatibacillum sp.]